MDSLLLFAVLTLWSLAVYHHLMYPLLLRLAERYLPIDQAPEYPAEEDLPEFSILVPAYNEASVIADKIRNIAALDYPPSRLKLIITCDGCSDGTAERARATLAEPEVGHLQVEIRTFSENRGKVAVLNELIPEITSPIVTLSDASALLSHDALRVAASRFQNPDIAVVAATYKLLTPGSVGEQRYWRYQTRILQNEALLGSPIGVHGALYFFRRDLFAPLPHDTINDDFMLPMSIVAQGYKACYEPNIVAVELEQATSNMDQARRVRISAGNLQQLLRLNSLLHPRMGAIALTFVSGKGLRALMPLILLCQLLLCVALSAYNPLFLLMSLAQLLAIVVAADAERLTRKIPLLRRFSPLFYIINGYRSGVIGSVRYLAGLENGHWKPVNKQEHSS